MTKKSYSDSKIKENLKKAINGLWYISETDSPFEFFELKENFEKTELIPSLTEDKNEIIINIDPEAFFGRLTAEKDWHSETDKIYLKKYRQLQKIFNNDLFDTKIFSSGRIHKQIFIVGRTDSGKWMGVKTLSLET